VRHGVLVVTNDPDRPEMTLSVSGFVTEFVKLTPKRIRLAGKVGEVVSAEVEIVPALPFEILEVKADPGTNVQVTGLEPGKQAGAYRLSVKNTAATSQRYQEKIILRTNHPTRPEFTIPIFGTIQP